MNGDIIFVRKFLKMWFPLFLFYLLKFIYVFNYFYGIIFKWLL